MMFPMVLFVYHWCNLSVASLVEQCAVIKRRGIDAAPVAPRINGCQKESNYCQS